MCVYDDMDMAHHETATALDQPSPGLVLSGQAAAGMGDTVALGGVRMVMRLLPASLAARGDIVALTEMLLAGLAAAFDAVCAYQCRKGPFEGQVFLARQDAEDYAASVASAHAAAETAFASVMGAGETMVTQGLPCVLDLDGARATFLWLGETRAGAFVLDRGGREFGPALLEEAAVCCAVAAEAIALAADIVQLEAETRHDFLTGLFNRAYFEQALPAEIERARRANGDFALVLMDLDGFKRFNDSFGHRRGDHFLEEVGSALTETLRRADIATRYGGDEFGLILPHTTPDQALIMLARVRERIASIADSVGADAMVGASFGIAHYPTDATTAEELLGVADSRLYHSKSQVKNGGSAGGPQKDDAPTGGAQKDDAPTESWKTEGGEASSTAG